MPRRPKTPLAQCEGFFAFRENIDEADNPYEYGSSDYWHWRRGWYAAKKEKDEPWYRKNTIWSAIVAFIIGLLLIVRPNLSDYETAFPGALLLIISILVFIANFLSRSGPVAMPPILLRSKRPRDEG